MVPNASPGGRHCEPGHDNIPITTAISTEPVKLSYKSMLVRYSELELYILTPWSTSTTRLEPGVTEVPLAGEPISILCAKHAVVKAASKAATVNFMASD